MLFKFAIALVISTSVAQAAKSCGCRSKKPSTTQEPPPVCDPAFIPAEAVLQIPLSSPPMTGEFTFVSECNGGFDLEIKAECTSNGFVFSIDCVASNPEKRNTIKRKVRDSSIDRRQVRSTQPVCNDDTFEFDVNGSFDPPFSHPAVDGEEGKLICDEELLEIVQITCTASGFELSAFCT